MGAEGAGVEWSMEVAEKTEEAFECMEESVVVGLSSGRSATVTMVFLVKDAILSTCGGDGMNREGQE